MKIQLKKSTYIFLLFFISGLVLLCHSFYSSANEPTADRLELTLKPLTEREQTDLIKAQEDQLDVTGPLVAQMSPQEAQSRVLNLQPKSVKNNPSQSPHPA